mmetsp:Transcript_24620/g.59371  ORF Transcript_24620/g.59371 Transcript_24620/m.59371 type:complete len:260 (+) Transcript_24620:441-1220(+)
MALPFNIFVHHIRFYFSLMSPPTQICIPNETDAIAEQHLELTRDDSEHESHGGYPHRPTDQHRIGNVISQPRRYTRVKIVIVIMMLHRTAIAFATFVLIGRDDDVFEHREARNKRGEEYRGEQSLIAEQPLRDGRYARAGNARHEEAVPAVDDGRDEEGAEDRKAQGSDPIEGRIVMRRIVVAFDYRVATSPPFFVRKRCCYYLRAGFLTAAAAAALFRADEVLAQEIPRSGDESRGNDFRRQWMGVEFGHVPLKKRVA